MFTREELQEIREKALESEINVQNPFWKDAYLDLAKAADVIDAMIARTIIVEQVAVAEKVEEDICDILQAMKMGYCCNFKWAVDSMPGMGASKKCEYCRYDKRRKTD